MAIPPDSRFPGQHWDLPSVNQLKWRYTVSLAAVLTFNSGT